ncbi:hypothetical protein FNU76_20000 [Chitinimonas arctica]|uniref:Uncharacterized protein n=1 Tax=Chitinimonas arctica TaxID=2594795 RepID=A0A516SJX7_9NEIS|nr:hypothetical protein [Chitinimonas arctica]QDQ28456.1 hypothetical protein FNU76_20000 [Chitinimonas arctica]
MSFGEGIGQQGWCAGAVVPADMLPAIANDLTLPGQPSPQIDPADWLVVVSQTCDVVAAKLEQEPLVELLHCQPIAKLRKGTKELRSTRHLDFKPNRQTHPDLCLTAHAVANRYHVPRQVLLGFGADPDKKLSDLSIDRILAWYALRYGRPSWPNNFVDRISGGRQALEDALESLADDIAQVRVGIAEKDDELPDGQSYHIAVNFVIDEGVWNGLLDARTTIYEAYADFVSVLNDCIGVEVNQRFSGVVSGAKFSWQEMQSTDEWNFANLTHRE